MFFLDARNNNYVYSYHLDTGAEKEYPTARFNISMLEALSIDIQQQLLFAIVTFNTNSSTNLVSWDYDVSHMEVVYSGDALPEYTERCVVSFIDVFNGTAVWIKRKNNYIGDIYKCHLTPKCLPEDLSVIYQSETVGRNNSLTTRRQFYDNCT